MPSTPYRRTGGQGAGTPAPVFSTPSDGDPVARTQAPPPTSSPGNGPARSDIAAADRYAVDGLPARPPSKVRFAADNPVRRTPSAEYRDKARIRVRKLLSPQPIPGSAAAQASAWAVIAKGPEPGLEIGWPNSAASRIDRLGSPDSRRPPEEIAQSLDQRGERGDEQISATMVEVQQHLTGRRRRGG